MKIMQQLSECRLVKLCRYGLLLVVVLSLSACKKELYSDLSEKEGNEMLSILLREGIDVEKVSQKKGNLVTLTVEGDDLSRSINVLKSHGFPRDEFASVGELFKKDGLISSPLEERTRYIYGLSQEIAATLSQLDGVITARVHVVIPDVKDKKSPVKVSSASVFIKYAENVKLDDFVPQIKMLVNNSIEGLNYDNISVALFPSQSSVTEASRAFQNVFSVQVSEESAARLMLMGWGALLLIAIALMGNVWLFLRLKKQPTLPAVQ